MVVREAQFWVKYLFSMNMIDLFYECEERYIANYADDTAPYICATS